jgi:hypothetical protein
LSLLASHSIVFVSHGELGGEFVSFALRFALGLIRGKTGSSLVLSLTKQEGRLTSHYGVIVIDCRVSVTLYVACLGGRRENVVMKLIFIFFGES